MSPLINAIFISYRRADLNQDQVNVIHEGLEREFGLDSVFLDISDIHSGAKWKEVLNQAGNDAKICLVLIGKNWLEKDKEGINRIKSEGDWVRKEIEYAIEKNLAIIPTLVNGGQLPSREDIPESIHSLFDSQAMNLDLSQWVIYREVFFRDIRKLLALDHVIEINRPIRFDFKRIALFILIPVLVLAGYLLLRKKPAANKQDAIPPVTISSSSGSAECPPFTQPQKLNTLIFPIESKQLENLERDIEDEFTRNCEKYGLSNENKIAGCYRGKELTSTDLPVIAKQLGADLYFSGILSSFGSQHRFKARFGLNNDSLNVINASTKNFDLTLSNVSLQEITGGQAVDTFYEHVFQYILGLVSYQNGNFKAAIQIFKDMNPSTIQNDTMQNVIYNIMADACVQSGKPDSALLYLQKLNNQIHADLNTVLKTSLLAEKYKKPELAIVLYSKLIDSSSLDKNVLREKRADQYKEIKDYSNAREDYQKIEAKEPKQKTRIETKVKEVDSKIASNKASVTSIKHMNATDDEKIELADKLLQIGQPKQANEVLKTIHETSPSFKQAEPLKQEAQIKINPAAKIQATESTMKANPRLNTEVLRRNGAVKKQN